MPKLLTVQREIIGVEADVDTGRVGPRDIRGASARSTGTRMLRGSLTPRAAPQAAAGTRLARFEVEELMQMYQVSAVGNSDVGIRESRYPTADLRLPKPV